MIPLYKVYQIPSKIYYSGYSLIAANSVEEANKMIETFKESDPRNLQDSFGYRLVDEYDIIEGLYADHDGFILHGINYHPN